MRLAAATQTLPGPTILSTRGTISVPYASAAMAWAPPILKTRCTPARRAAISTSGGSGHRARGGVAMKISGTSTTEAGTAFMITLDG